jgi:hypothetical protein
MESGITIGSVGVCRIKRLSGLQVLVSKRSRQPLDKGFSKTWQAAEKKIHPSEVASYAHGTFLVKMAE